MANPEKRKKRAKEKAKQYRLQKAQKQPQLVRIRDEEMTPVEALMISERVSVSSDIAELFNSIPESTDLYDAIPRVMGFCEKNSPELYREKKEDMIASLLALLHCWQLENKAPVKRIDVVMALTDIMNDPNFDERLEQVEVLLAS